MKKLMVIAAAASLAAVAEAGIFVNTNCHPRSTTCPVVAFKVTASGKIAAPVEKKNDVYKTVSKLSIKKGALVMFGAGQATGYDKDGVPYTFSTGDDCCYEAYSLYLQVKVNKKTYPVGVFYQPIDSWSIFGKEHNKMFEADKSKKFKVECQLGLSYAVSSSIAGNGIATSDASGVTGNQPGGLAGDTLTDSASYTLTGDQWNESLGIATDFGFIATAFGNGTWKYSYSESGSACSVCVSESSSYTPGNYSGWFAGIITDLGGDSSCFMCDCTEFDVFGGTWKAKYDKAWSRNAAGWEKASSYVFGAAVTQDMITQCIE